MKYSITTTLEKIQALEQSGKRTWVVQGGTSAGKTVAILLYIANYLVENPHKETWVVSDTLANLKDGAMMDFMSILHETNLIAYFSWNKSESIGTFKNGSIIKFRGVDTMRGHGPRRDLLYVNEANRIDWETYRQLAIRTREWHIIDFNPVNEFWAHKELVNHAERSNSTAFIKVNYLDNEALDEDVLHDLEAERGDGTSNWWKVYGLGEIGSLEGNVYEGWLSTDRAEIEKGKLIRYGLDFGYNDPTAMVAIYELEDGATGIVELLYQQKMTDEDYIQAFKELGIDPTVVIVADSARPETIAAINAAGYSCVGALKDKGSVMRGIRRVAKRRIRYHGKNLEREFMTYPWRKKRSSGETLDVPQDGNDHLMDALRYAIDDLDQPKFDF